MRVNAQRVAKPATLVRVGDGLTFAVAGRVHALHIIALGARRGPAPEAQALYAEIGNEPVTGEPPLEPGAEADT